MQPRSFWPLAALIPPAGFGDDAGAKHLPVTGGLSLSLLHQNMHQLKKNTRIMVSKGTWHKTSTQNLRVFWRFWVLITLTSTLNPICPVLRYPCGKQFFSTKYPSNETYFPDKKPYSGDFQYKKSHFGKKCIVLEGYSVLKNCFS